MLEAILGLRGQVSSARTADARRLIERQIAATDGQIDRLVYDLYALTDAEIAIVEGATV